MRDKPPHPPVTDGVVTLRPWAPADASSIAEACREEEIAQWLDQIPQPYTEDDARMYVELCEVGWREGTSSTFAITDRASGEVLGSIGLRHLPGLDEGTSEIGYWVKQPARGRGVATRALRLVSHWAISELRIPRLQLRADEQNEPSKRVAERAGFTREGVLRASRYNARQQRRVDFVMYSLLPEDL
ncbi:MAG: GNAT family N-acetyltransferase [Actinomycetota bacterium]|nr:GNAT family N-acetyltransferase [Actinomycetota bacterium]